MGFFSDNLEKDKLKSDIAMLRMRCQVYLDELKDSIVELMNEGWEEHGGMTRNSDGEFPTEYSQIMRKVK